VSRGGYGDTFERTSSQDGEPAFPEADSFSDIRGGVRCLGNAVDKNERGEEVVKEPPDVLTFLLVPDASAARRVRRMIAERGACSGLLVGSWAGLIDAARRAYLAPVSPTDWVDAFDAALAATPDAFWERSLEVAPVETTRAVEAALAQLYGAHPVAEPLDFEMVAVLPERPRRHVRDLLRLIESLNGRLPDDLTILRDLLAADAADALHAVRVVQVDGVPSLTCWQQALVDKLNLDAAARGAVGSDSDELEILRSAFSAAAVANRPGALGVLQARLFTGGGDPEPLDDSVQWVGVRDFLQEAEVAAGMVQRMLEERPDLRPAEIGLLVPDSFEYAVALKDAFRLAGLPLSGLQVEHWRRDFGREAVFHFLYCRQRPAPAMALAVCLASPLMPWSREEGGRLAQSVMDGDYRLRAPAAAGAAGQRMLACCEEKTASRPPWREPFGTSPNFSTATSSSSCIGYRRAMPRIGSANSSGTAPRSTGPLCGALPNRGSSPSGEASRFQPRGSHGLEGVAGGLATGPPTAGVGLRAGALPRRPGAVPCFPPTISRRYATGWVCRSLRPLTNWPEGAARLRRQLGAVARRLPSWFRGGISRASRRHLRTPGSSCTRCLRVRTRRKNACWTLKPPACVTAFPTSPWPSLPPRNPPTVPYHDLRFDRDLLQLRMGRDGVQRPESPSGLETLMVSRLAWLLRRLQAEPLGWAPESPDARLLGTLAHAVFEQLFRPGVALPERAALEARDARPSGCGDS
jgi:ATP-dependent helicase/nuclease subunit B